MKWIMIATSIGCGLAAWAVTWWWLGLIVSVGAYASLTDETTTDRFRREIERDAQIRAAWHGKKR